MPLPPPNERGGRGDQKGPLEKGAPPEGRWGFLPVCKILVPREMKPYLTAYNLPPPFSKEALLHDNPPCSPPCPIHFVGRPPCRPAIPRRARRPRRAASHHLRRARHPPSSLFTPFPPHPLLCKHPIPSFCHPRFTPFKLFTLHGFLSIFRPFARFFQLTLPEKFAKMGNCGQENVSTPCPIPKCERKRNRRILLWLNIQRLSLPI